MKEVCDQCPNEGCEIRTPTKISGKPSRNNTFCVHYTCVFDGIQATEDAINRDPEPINTPEGKILATRFGSDTKPTHASRHFGRYVGGDGTIYSGNFKEGVFRKSGQKAIKIEGDSDIPVAPV